MLKRDMDVFEASDYREIIDRYLVSDSKNSRGQRTKLSQDLKMHSSHFSQIMAGSRSLTPDQALLFVRLLGFSDLETEYFLTLVHQERAASFEFKKYCQQKLTEIRSSAKKVSQRFAHKVQLSEEFKAKFYSHYLYSAIRLYCSTGTRGRTIEEIQIRFDISRERLMPIIRFLLEADLLLQKQDYFQMGVASTFLPRDSPHIHRHHANWRLLAIHDSPRLDEEELMFTAPMSISTEDFQKIRERLAKEISFLSKTIQDSPADEIACLNIDFYKIKK